MHWPAYDRTTWGLIISICALVLAFPLSLLANLLTPKIKNWWAERSEASMRKRIIKLEEELAHREEYHPVLTLFETYALLGIELTLMLGAFALISFAASVAFLFVNKILVVPKIQEAYAVFITVGAIVISSGVNFGVVPKISNLRQRDSPRGRNRMKNSISELKARLG
jgi:hypothetical protein